MTEPFALGRFLTDWRHAIRYDLTASECASIPLADLLALARSEDANRWETLTLDYPDHRGAAYLRDSIAARYAGKTEAHVVCAAGAQEAIACLARAVLTPADHAVIILPIYQPSEHIITELCAATGVALQAPDWRLDLDRVAAAIRPNTRLILMNFPNSPTGATLDRATLDGLIGLCRRHGLWLVNDEVYRGTEPDAARRMPPIAELYERGISINAVSKSFGLPGLRVGWLVSADPAIVPGVMLRKSHLSASLAAPSEVLAQIALTHENFLIARNLRIAAANRRHFDDFVARQPDQFENLYQAQTVWAFPRYLGPEGADRFATRLAQDAGVLLLPSSLWHSPLAATPAEHLRIGLSRGDIRPALAAIERQLDHTRRNHVTEPIA
jgi:aspartate/methionine/tyrosine aminotransferase